MRPKGPPSRAGAARDREGLKRAVEALRELLPGAVLLGGSSYGGRQCSMLAAELPDLVDALLLLSYPLHPPGKPEQLRTEHFPRIKTPALFAHGTHDNFGSLDELEAALPLLAGPSELLAFDGARHGLVKRSGGGESIRGVAGRIAERFVDFAGL
jgi:predicted alpha/beta-hydrolase family hydrolase